MDLLNDSSETSSDYDKYFILKTEHKPKIPPKLSSEQIKMSHEFTKKTSNSESSNSEYLIPNNKPLFNLEVNEFEKEKNASVSSNNNSKKSRDSFLLDKILLKPTKIDQPDKYFSNALENLNQNQLEDRAQSNKPFLELDSLQSDYNSEEENSRISNQGPSAETLEIIRRLREIPSQSASPEINGKRIIDSELTRETKLSGGKQRKPNEESFDMNIKRTSSSNSNLGVRNNFFNKLFRRDKFSSGPTKKKKNFFKK